MSGPVDEAPDAYLNVSCYADPVGVSLVENASSRGIAVTWDQSIRLHWAISGKSSGHPDNTRQNRMVVLNLPEPMGRTDAFSRLGRHRTEVVTY